MIYCMIQKIPSLRRRDLFVCSTAEPCSPLICQKDADAVSASFSCFIVCIMIAACFSIGRSSPSEAASRRVFGLLGALRCPPPEGNAGGRCPPGGKCRRALPARREMPAGAPRPTQAFQFAMDSSTLASFSFAFASFSRSFWISCAGAFSQKPGLLSFF